MCICNVESEYTLSGSIVNRMRFKSSYSLWIKAETSLGHLYIHIYLRHMEKWVHLARVSTLKNVTSYESPSRSLIRAREVEKHTRQHKANCWDINSNGRWSFRKTNRCCKKIIAVSLPNIGRKLSGHVLRFRELSAIVIFHEFPYALTLRWHTGSFRTVSDSWPRQFLPWKSSGLGREAFFSMRQWLILRSFPETFYIEVFGVNK